ncbi:MAG: hypothetical protein Kow0063_04320 [Anaerolineae bacterium]
MRINRYEIAGLLVACAFAILFFTCHTTPTPGPACPDGGSTRTQGCDEFKRWQSQVFKNSSVFTLADWHPLNAGDELSTDGSGEAELNLSDCWAGRIFIFKNSGGHFKVAQCSKAEYPTAGTCIPFGTWYVGKCAGEFDLNTGSAKVVKRGTSYSATFLHENREITLVVVLQDGQVSVKPVATFDPMEFGPATDVSEGQFYFTMPNAVLSDIAGLAPRTAHPLEDLLPVVDELRIRDWMFDVHKRAAEDDVLPGNWPPELVAGEPATEAPAVEEVAAEAPAVEEAAAEEPAAEEGFFVTTNGGVLADPRVQEALVRGVDWSVAGGDGGGVTAFVGNQPLDAVNDLSYDPERALELLAEAGIEPGMPVTVLYPAEDPQLGQAAGAAAEYLGKLDIDAVIVPVPGDELDAQMAVRARDEEPVMVLAR